jgi:CRP/FNR family cyclic AMP-dependent transcriptional regulator
MRNEEIASLLGRTPAFSGLDRQTLEQMARSAHSRSYPRGDSIFHEGESGDCLYVVAGGLVKVFTASESGDEMLLATLRPPDMFGELALIDGGPRSASAAALEPTLLLVITRTAFFELIRRYPSALEGVLRSVATLLRNTLGRASDLVFLDLPGRVAKMLVEIAEERGEDMVGGIGLSLGIKQSDFAAMVGGSRPTVNQILHAFEERGYLMIHGRQIVVKQLDQLRRRAAL